MIGKLIVGLLVDWFNGSKPSQPFYPVLHTSSHPHYPSLDSAEAEQLCVKSKKQHKE